MYIFHSRNADTLCRKNALIPILSSMLLSHYNRHFVVQVALTCFDVRILKYFHDGPLNVLKGVSLTLLGSRHIECRDSLLESIWPQLSSIFSLRFSCRRCLTFFFLSPTSTSSGLQLVVLTLSAVLFFGSLLSRLFFSPLLPFFYPFLSFFFVSVTFDARQGIRAINTISIRRRILIIASKAN